MAFEDFIFLLGSSSTYLALFTNLSQPHSYPEYYDYGPVSIPQSSISLGKYFRLIQHLIRHATGTLNMSGAVMLSHSQAQTSSGSTMSQHNTWAASTTSSVKPPAIGSLYPTMISTETPTTPLVVTHTITGQSSWLARTTRSPSRTTMYTTLRAGHLLCLAALFSTPSTAFVSGFPFK